ncbi:hypothetical protein BLNAU_9901 [Blattamonas nauphoetae]|uniref:Uncharacterized protein n=1 Tax=Blattamonas nauphoetae TaxID=2049346 RepID=A0ABQ9XUL1_9EUKA|nr:hypothetical protein BLNAU_9901 [Blattamonas nauphoetae]
MPPKISLDLFSDDEPESKRFSPTDADFLIAEAISTNDILARIAVTLSDILESSLPRSDDHLSSLVKKINEDAKFARGMAFSIDPFSTDKLRTLKEREMNLLEALFPSENVSAMILASESKRDHFGVPSPRLITIPALLSCLTAAKCFNRILSQKSGFSRSDTARKEGIELAQLIKREQTQAQDFERRVRAMEEENEKLRNEGQTIHKENEHIERKIRELEHQTQKKKPTHNGSHSSEESDSNDSLSDTDSSTLSSSSDNIPLPELTIPQTFQPSNELSPTNSVLSKPAICMAKRPALSVNTTLIQRRAFNTKYPVALCPLTIWPAHQALNSFLFTVAQTAERVFSISNRSLTRTISNHPKTIQSHSSNESQPIVFQGLIPDAQSLIVSLSTLVTLITPSTDRDTMEPSLFFGHFQKYMMLLRHAGGVKLLSSIVGECADVVSKSRKAGISLFSSIALIASLSSIAVTCLCVNHSSVDPSLFEESEDIHNLEARIPPFDLTNSLVTPDCPSLNDFIDCGGVTSLAILLTASDPTQTFPDDAWLPQSSIDEPTTLKKSTRPSKRSNQPDHLIRAEYLLKINSHRDICSVLSDELNWFPLTMSLSHISAMFISDHTQNSIYGVPRRFLELPPVYADPGLCEFLLRLLQIGLKSFYSLDTLISHNPLIDDEGGADTFSSSVGGIESLDVRSNPLSWFRCRFSLGILHCMCLNELPEHIYAQLSQKLDLFVHCLRFTSDHSIIVHCLSILLSIFSKSSLPTDKQLIQTRWAELHGDSYLISIILSSPLISPGPTDPQFVPNSLTPPPIIIRASHSSSITTDSEFFLPPSSLSDHLHILSLTFSLYSCVVSTKSDENVSGEGEGGERDSVYEMAVDTLNRLAPIWFWVDGGQDRHASGREERELGEEEEERFVLPLSTPSVAHLFPFSCQLPFSSMEQSKVVMERAIGSILTFIGSLFTSCHHPLSSSFFSTFTLTPHSIHFSEKRNMEKETNLDERAHHSKYHLPALFQKLFFFLIHPSQTISEPTIRILRILSNFDTGLNTPQGPKREGKRRKRVGDTFDAEMGRSVIAGFDLNRSGWWVGRRNSEKPEKPPKIKKEEKMDEISSGDGELEEIGVEVMRTPKQNQTIPQQPNTGESETVPLSLVVSLAVLSSPHNSLSLLSRAIQSFTSLSSRPQTHTPHTSILETISSSLTTLLNAVTIRTILHAELRNFDSPHLKQSTPSLTDISAKSTLLFPSSSVDGIPSSVHAVVESVVGTAFEKDSIGSVTHIIFPALFHLLSQILTYVKNGRQTEQIPRTQQDTKAEGENRLIQAKYGQDHQILSQCVTLIVSTLILLLSPSSLTMMNPSLPLLPQPFKNHTLNLSTVNKINSHSSSTSQHFNSLPSLLSYSYSLLPSLPLSSFHNKPQQTNAIAYTFPSTLEIAFLDQPKLHSQASSFLANLPRLHCPPIFQTEEEISRHNPSFFVALFYQGYMFRPDAVLDSKWEEALNQLEQAKQMEHLPQFVVNARLNASGRTMEQMRMPTERQLDHAPVDQFIATHISEFLPSLVADSDVTAHHNTNLRPIEHAVRSWEQEWSPDWIARLIVDMQSLAVNECVEWVEQEHNSMTRRSKGKTENVIVSGLPSLLWIDHTTQVFLLSTLLCSLEMKDEEKLADALIPLLSSISLLPLLPPEMKDDSNLYTISKSQGKQRKRKKDESKRHRHHGKGRKTRKDKTAEQDGDEDEQNGEDDDMEDEGDDGADGEGDGEEDWGRYLNCVVSLAGHALTFKHSLRLSHSILSFLSSLLSTFSFTPSTFSALLTFTLPLVTSPSLTSLLHSFANPSIFITHHDLHELYSEMILQSQPHSTPLAADLLSKTIIQNKHTRTLPSSTIISPPLIRIRLFFLPLFVMLDTVSIMSSLLLIFRPLTNSHIHSFFFSQYKLKRNTQKLKKSTSKPHLNDNPQSVQKGVEEEFGRERWRVLEGVVCIVKNLLVVSSIDPFRTSSVSTSCLCHHSPHSLPNEHTSCRTALLFSDLMRFLPSPVCPDQLTRGVRLQAMQSLSSLLQSPFILNAVFYTSNSLSSFISSSLAIAIVTINQARVRKKRNAIEFQHFLDDDKSVPDEIIVENPEIERRQQYLRQHQTEEEEKRRNQRDVFDLTLQALWDEEDIDPHLEPLKSRTTEEFSLLLHPPLKHKSKHNQPSSSPEHLDTDLLNTFLRFPTSFGLSENSLLAPTLSLTLSLLSSDRACLLAAVERDYFPDFVFPFFLFQGQTKFSNFSVSKLIVEVMMVLFDDSTIRVEFTAFGRMLTTAKEKLSDFNVVDRRMADDDKWDIKPLPILVSPQHPPNIAHSPLHQSTLHSNHTHRESSLEKLLNHLVFFTTLFRLNGGFTATSQHELEEREKSISDITNVLAPMRRKKALKQIETAWNDGEEKVLFFRWHGGEQTIQTESPQSQSNSIGLDALQSPTLRYESPVIDEVSQHNEARTPRSMDLSPRGEDEVEQANQNNQSPRSSHPLRNAEKPIHSDSELFSRIVFTLGQMPMVERMKQTEEERGVDEEEKPEELDIRPPTPVFVEPVVPETIPERLMSIVKEKDEESDGSEEDSESSSLESLHVKKHVEQEETIIQDDPPLLPPTSLSSFSLTEIVSTTQSSLLRFGTSCLGIVTKLVGMLSPTASTQLQSNLIRTSVDVLHTSCEQLKLTNALLFDIILIPSAAEMIRQPHKKKNGDDRDGDDEEESLLPLVFLSRSEHSSVFRSDTKSAPLQPIQHRQSTQKLLSLLSTQTDPTNPFPLSSAITPSFITIHSTHFHLLSILELVRDSTLRILSICLRNLKKWVEKEEAKETLANFITSGGVEAVKQSVWEEDKQRRLVEWCRDGIRRQIVREWSKETDSGSVRERDEHESELFFSFIVSVFPSHFRLALSHSILLSPAQSIVSGILSTLLTHEDAQNRIVDSNLSRFGVMTCVKSGQLVVNSRFELISVPSSYSQTLSNVFSSLSFSLLAVLSPRRSHLSRLNMLAFRAEMSLFGGLFAISCFVDDLVRNDTTRPSSRANGVGTVVKTGGRDDCITMLIGMLEEWLAEEERVNNADARNHLSTRSASQSPLFHPTQPDALTKPGEENSPNDGIWMVPQSSRVYPQISLFLVGDDIPFAEVRRRPALPSSLSETMRVGGGRMRKMPNVGTATPVTTLVELLRDSSLPDIPPFPLGTSEKSKWLLDRVAYLVDEGIVRTNNLSTVRQDYDNYLQRREAMNFRGWKVCENDGDETESDSDVAETIRPFDGISLISVTDNRHQ